MLRIESIRGELKTPPRRHIPDFWGGLFGKVKSEKDRGICQAYLG
jgi:hypothetical protein